ncbi:VV D6-like helicase [Orpheovirus IHUMI-LCC2]|uniref:VV D6-like helicase n=1 Tax=Orpheovirus IHUMI-LCC2 TaxID=2023057 RepID=A0A2I2L311_9VIRU|nr:VV D6-like helicase [Orpheovirus IHUMI-LCC2]SNW61922.1 VV D6-like helicase [Orpheovirus IHUMI-LCC2]
MENFQVADLLTYYEPIPPSTLNTANALVNAPNGERVPFQTYITAKKEFNELASDAREITPARGRLYKHQELVVRYLREYDRLMLIHDTGTGKSCVFTGIAEYLKNTIPELAGARLTGTEGSLGGSHNITNPITIKQALFISRGDTLLEEIRKQIVCRCTPPGVYETPEVLSARTAGAREGRIKTELKKWYIFDKFLTFSSQLARMNDQDIIENYSYTFIFIDEFHLLRNDPSITSKKKHAPEILVQARQQIMRLCRLVKNSKIVVASATPMVDDVNEVTVGINFLRAHLPLEQQMPENIDYSKSNITREFVEPYFRGLISYVRRLDTGAVPVYRGTNIQTRNDDGTIRTYNIKGQESLMRAWQAARYDVARREGGNVRKSEREASSFIFPNGKWGKEGFNDYVIPIPSIGWYEPNRELLSFFRNVYSDVQDPTRPLCLQDLSAKYVTILELISQELNKPVQDQGVIFCFHDIISGSGLTIFCLCLQYVLGLQRFTETGSIYQGVAGEVGSAFCSSSGPSQSLSANYRNRVPRFALLTSRTNKSEFAAMMEAVNSPENLHGDIIKVFVSGPIGKDGINVNNVVQIHKFEEGWNSSSSYQAISRGIRSTSHNDLINEKATRLYEQMEYNGTPITMEEARDRIRIDVDIYRHVLVDPTEQTTVDIDECIISEDKDIDIMRMFRYMIECSIDCHIHYRRNRRTTDINGSRECQYTNCDYVCVNPAPNYIDTTTYDILYSQESIDKVKYDIIEYFKNYTTVSLQTLYSLYKYEPKYIDMAIGQLVEDKVKVINRFGYPCYVRNDGEIVYLQYDYPFSLVTTTRDTYTSSYYINHLVGLSKTSLSEYNGSVKSELDRPKIDKLKELPSGDLRFNALLDSLSIDSKVALLEDSIYDVVTNAQVTDQQRLFQLAIIENFKDYFHPMREPVKEINKMIDKLTGKDELERAATGKGKRGRKPKLENQSKIKPLKEDDFNKLEEDLDTEEVYVHTLYSKVSDRTAYNMMAKLNKAEGRTRILKLSEGRWRDANVYELPAYNAFIQRNIYEGQRRYRENPLYGTLTTTDGKFRISDVETERLNLLNINNKNDARRRKNGRNCETFPKAEIINVLRRLNIQPPNNEVLRRLNAEQLKTETINQISNANRQTMVNRIISENILDVATVQALSDVDLKWYYTWSFYIIKNQICPVIQEYFRDNNLLQIK